MVDEGEGRGKGRLVNGEERGKKKRWRERSAMKYRRRRNTIMGRERESEMKEKERQRDRYSNSRADGFCCQERSTGQDPANLFLVVRFRKPDVVSGPSRISFPLFCTFTRQL